MQLRLCSSSTNVPTNTRFSIFLLFLWFFGFWDPVQQQHQVFCFQLSERETIFFPTLLFFGSFWFGGFDWFQTRFLWPFLGRARALPRGRHSRSRRKRGLLPPARPPLWSCLLARLIQIFVVLSKLLLNYFLSIKKITHPKSATLIFDIPLIFDVK